jgi:hypothetical protein
MRRFALLFASSWLLACSGGDFGVGDVADTSSDDTSVASETSAETEVDGGSTDSASEADTCVTNACGGCTVLVGKPGDPCQSCGGKLKCKGTDALECDSAGPKNACGGCSVLANAKDSPCGVCMTGSYVCNGTDDTKCNDPVTGPMPGSACGCGTALHVICDATAPGGTRCEGDDHNKCGGCGTLTPALDTACGVCGSGKYACDATMVGKTACVDPVPPGSPMKGTACGTCKTHVYDCAPDGKSIICKGGDVDTNACGGCSALPFAKDSACGVCGGTYACNGSNAVKCTDANPVPLSTKCGYCGTSTQKCDTATKQTVCAKPDDRVDGVDKLAEVSGGPARTILANDRAAISFKTPRAGAVNGFIIELFRYDASSSAMPGVLRFRLILGTPATPATASDVLATIDVPTTAVTSGFQQLSVKFPSATANYPAGTAMYVEMTNLSYAYNWGLSGGTPPTPSLVDEWHSPAGTSSYLTITDHDPFFRLTMTGCY